AFCHIICGSMSMRSMVLTLFVLSMAGTGGELLLLGHTHGIIQLIPVVVLVMSVLVLMWHGLERKSSSLRTFQLTMLLMVVSGLVGTALHYRANAAFERKGNPKIAGMDLLSKALVGTAPALAPGAMIQLGLLGLVYTFRHPALVSKEKR